MTTNLGQHVGLIGADIKDLLVFFRLESVQPHGEHRQLTRAAGGFEQAIRVSVIAGRGIGLNVPDASHVIVIVGVAAIVAHIFIFDAFIIECAEDLFRGLAQFDAQMVHQL